jgi:DinB superfamily/Pentapeptide repeats (8 copies)
MTKFVGSAEFRGAEFVDVDLSGAVFREANLSGARMYGVLLMGADIDGAIDGLKVNGVEVRPLIEAELDRLHPERTALRPSTPDGAREAWRVLEEMWAPTMRRAAGLSEADLRRSVNDEWSFVETLRHLVFVTDAWFRNAVLADPNPFHPIGLPASFMTDAETFGIDPSADPTLSEVLEVRAERLGMVRTYLDKVTQADLDAVREPGVPGWPPPPPRPALSCLQVLLNDEWAHHQFAVRDLAIIEQS